MSEMLLTRTPAGTLAPTDDEDAERLRRIKVGTVVRCEVTQVRNYRFLKKFMALVRFAFDAWEGTMPRQEYKGRPIRASIKRFRSDLTIMAGFYEAVWNIRGEMRVEAKSISFANMDEDEFEKLYSQFLQVVLDKVLDSPRYTQEEVNRLVDQLMRFDG